MATLQADISSSNLKIIKDINWMTIEKWLAMQNWQQQKKKVVKHTSLGSGPLEWIGV
jgi:hypothetical protein